MQGGRQVQPLKALAGWNGPSLAWQFGGTRTRVWLNPEWDEVETAGAQKR